jgi:hypothetical protein
MQPCLTVVNAQAAAERPQLTLAQSFGISERPQFAKNDWKNGFVHRLSVKEIVQSNRVD